jgi:hypothetical protein
MEKQDDNNELKWSSDIEWVLDKIRFNSLIFSKEHKKRYLYLKKTLKYYRIPIIILSAVNSVVSVGAQPFFIQQTVSLTNCVLSLLCGIIGSIELFFGIQSQMEIEMNSSKEYYILSSDIFKTISLLRCNRQTDGKTFLNESYSTYVKLVESSCIIRKKLEDKLKPIDDKVLKNKSYLTNSKNNSSDNKSYLTNSTNNSLSNSSDNSENNSSIIEFVNNNDDKSYDLI